MPGENDRAIRLDAALVRRGLESSRERAKARILAGDVWVNGKPVAKPSALVDEEAEILCKGEGLAYVGRGGCKLEKAIAGRLDVSGAVAMDVGASTGGFTDCLLKSRAARVYAVDVGHGQLHPSLVADPRVVNLEGTDIRSGETLRGIIPAGSVNFCAVDVSFISLTRVLPAVLPFLKENAVLVCLIKPQFEAGRAAVGKRGVVKDPRVHCRVLDELCAFFMGLGFSVRWLDFSPITGGDGNIEFLAGLRYDREKPAVPGIADVVACAHRALKG